MASKQRNMTKADLIHEVASRTGLNKTDTRVIIETFLQVIKESIISGFSIQIRGFGSFFRKQRASKKARNISKGTTIDIPAHEIPKFKPCKSFIESVKEK